MGGGVDCDCHWLRRIGAIDIRPPQFGHVFGTMAQSPFARRGTSKQDLLRHYETDYLAAPQDRVFIASPFAFPPDSPLFPKLVEALAPSRGRIVFMDFMAQVVRANGLEYAYTKPEVFSPLHHWLSRQRVMRECEDPKLVGAVSRSIGVNAFWSSTSECDKKSKFSAELLFERGSSASMEKDSLWASVLAKAATSATRPKRTIDQVSNSISPVPVRRRVRGKCPRLTRQKSDHGGGDPPHPAIPPIASGKLATHTHNVLARGVAYVHG